MSDSTPGPTPAGWYPDPQDPSFQRYWDGRQWTEHRSPVAPATAPAAATVGTAYGSVVPAQPPSSGSSSKLWLVVGAVVVALLLLVVVVVVVIRGSSSGDPTVAVPSAAPTAQTPPEEPASETAAPPATEQPTEEAPPVEGAASFGQPVTYDSGLAVTVSQPEPFKPSDTAAGYESGQTAMVMTIEITNGSAEAYDPALFTMSASAGADGVECDSVFDTAKGLDGVPSTSVQPGRKTTFKWGFACDAGPGEEVVMDVNPDFLVDSFTLVGVVPG